MDEQVLADLDRVRTALRLAKRLPPYGEQAPELLEDAIAALEEYFRSEWWEFSRIFPSFRISHGKTGLAHQGGAQAR